ncbi:hypothetical protein AAFF_G00145280 [Aldrovandia affinis]|uniref:Uncharacterized protein n=1 Tax=Aldrovandia affinis TaxID=143900 RepID=A0AAD7T0P2_9TELE|nr:hypothetical protein AAFF_G00145280 [Aldrovandia affinis]
MSSEVLSKKGVDDDIPARPLPNSDHKTMEDAETDARFAQCQEAVALQAMRSDEKQQQAKILAGSNALPASAASRARWRGPSPGRRRP